MGLKEKCKELAGMYASIFGKDNVKYDVDGNACIIRVEFPNKKMEMKFKSIEDISKEIEAVKKVTE